MSQHTHPTKPAKHDTDAAATHKTPPQGPSGGRGQNEGIGTESNPHGAVSPDPRKHRGQNEGLGTESTPSAAPAGKPSEDGVRSAAPQKPVSSGPTVADADAPILEGHDGEEYETVRLTDGPVGPEDGVKVRVAKPLPLVVVSGGRRYMRSTKDLYVAQVP
jgi:hypothetical protein